MGIKVPNHPIQTHQIKKNYSILATIAKFNVRQFFPVYNSCPEGFECRNVIHKRYHIVQLLPVYENIHCMACFITSLCPYLSSGITRILSLAGATPLFSFLVVGSHVKCPGSKPSGLEVVQKHIDRRWSVHSAPRSHSCVEHSLAIIYVWTSSMDRVTGNASRCGHVGKQSILATVCPRSGMAQKEEFSSYGITGYYMAGPQIPYLFMECGLVYETKEVRGHITL